jgi:hypothetical protein
MFPLTPTLSLQGRGSKIPPLLEGEVLGRNAASSEVKR